MAIQDSYAATAESSVAVFGEVIILNGAPADAIVDRKVLDLDEYGTVKGSYIAIAVLAVTAAAWGVSPLFMIDSRPHHLVDTLDESAGLHRYRLAPT